MKNIDELTDEQKQNIVDEINASDDEQPEGNLTVSTASEDPEVKGMLDKVSPKDLYEAQISANFRSNYHLGQLLPKLSKKNLMKLLMFTCKLPEKDGTLEFGGTKQQKEMAYEAMMQAQIASNSKTYILSVDAAARARLDRENKSSGEQVEEENATKDS